MHNHSLYTSPFETTDNGEEVFVLPHFKWAGLNGNDPASGEDVYLDERWVNHYEHIICAHLLKSDNKPIIQYWMFYPYNDASNNHEGDWEHINVHLNSQNPSTVALNRKRCHVRLRAHPRQ